MFTTVIGVCLQNHKTTNNVQREKNIYFIFAKECRATKLDFNIYWEIERKINLWVQ